MTHALSPLRSQEYRKEMEEGKAVLKKTKRHKNPLRHELKTMRYTSLTKYRYTSIISALSIRHIEMLPFSSSSRSQKVSAATVACQNAPTSAAYRNRIWDHHFQSYIPNPDHTSFPPPPPKRYISH
ncbi:hypothetical protein, unlikely [Trypanosoma brucei gambiense DAL972]|uniref:Uncharacterized protein n=1 Tax=Trypanosoma brucei gambiense (strain MHOM/CI/86/DAL972) TaxID=679716 RepID=D0A104_TRYB9|nr:hypothetical protein, unlikely [Trypanosoma brucei gambiense DAL972]CBH14946.1 hypothetical protein, unlikely [Trypanosoma brucei gambiense DAL972]|eukprot:XP_011777212.1 hypothetical protein, unlikely [Trypanosoma brucei gambiense DAL972]